MLFRSYTCLKHLFYFIVWLKYFTEVAFRTFQRIQKYESAFRQLKVYWSQWPRQWASLSDISDFHRFCRQDRKISRTLISIMLLNLLPVLFQWKEICLYYMNYLYLVLDCRQPGPEQMLQRPRPSDVVVWLCCTPGLPPLLFSVCTSWLWWIKQIVHLLWFKKWKHLWAY